MSGCAIAACPGPAAVPVTRGIRRGRAVEEVETRVCRLHADTGVVAAELDDLGHVVWRADLTRLRYSATSRRGRMFRMMLGAIGRR